MNPPKPRSHWDVPLKSVWSFIDTVTHQPIRVRVTRKFDTTDGKFVSLDTLDNKRWGNAPIDALGERVR